MCTLLNSVLHDVCAAYNPPTLYIIPQQVVTSTELPQLQPIFTEDSASVSDRPTLQLLKRFPTQSGRTTNIIERIGSKCRDLCTYLLRDNWGAVIKSMELEHRNNHYRIAETILQRWLAEKLNASWAELVSALRNIGLGRLAREIEVNFH